MDLGTLLWYSRRLDQQFQAEQEAQQKANAKAKQSRR